ncbi:MAG: MgtC/SapB family protein [bacterium]|nr:MgtC/SapB family protein [bacterium]
MISLEIWQIIMQLSLAVLFGGLIGLERESRKKEAGLKTYSLVTLGSCIFTIIAFKSFYFLFDVAGISFDPSRIIQAIAIGIGFIGAGVIFRQPSGTVGLTTAAGLWVAASVGIAIGCQFYSLAIIGTFLILFILVGFGFIERKMFKDTDG